MKFLLIYISVCLFFVSISFCVTMRRLTNLRPVFPREPHYDLDSEDNFEKFEDAAILIEKFLRNNKFENVKPTLKSNADKTHKNTEKYNRYTSLNEENINEIDNGKIRKELLDYDVDSKKQVDLNSNVGGLNSSETKQSQSKAQNLTKSEENKNYIWVSASKNDTNTPNKNENITIKKSSNTEATNNSAKSSTDSSDKTNIKSDVNSNAGKNSNSNQANSAITKTEENKTKNNHTNGDNLNENSKNSVANVSQQQKSVKPTLDGENKNTNNLQKNSQNSKGNNSSIPTSTSHSNGDITKDKSNSQPLKNTSIKSNNPSANNNNSPNTTSSNSSVKQQTNSNQTLSKTNKNNTENMSKTLKDTNTNKPVTAHSKQETIDSKSTSTQTPAPVISQDHSPNGNSENNKTDSSNDVNIPNIFKHDDIKVKNGEIYIDSTLAFGQVSLDFSRNFSKNKI